MVFTSRRNRKAAALVGIRYRELLQVIRRRGDREARSVAIAAMQMGSGWKIHSKANELPSGRLVVSTSTHLTDCGRRRNSGYPMIVRAVKRDAYTGTDNRRAKTTS